MYITDPDGLLSDIPQKSRNTGQLRLLSQASCCGQHHPTSRFQPDPPVAVRVWGGGCCFSKFPSQSLKSAQRHPFRAQLFPSQYFLRPLPNFAESNTAAPLHHWICQSADAFTTTGCYCPVTWAPRRPTAPNRRCHCFFFRSNPRTDDPAGAVCHVTWRTASSSAH
ncbi:hypothetical protein VTK26DRAFT_5153 [Humicola hyalothermophila]